MNKKQYIAPATDAYSLDSARPLLTDSGDENVYGGSTGNSSDDTVSPGDALSNSFWRFSWDGASD